ncbi:CBL-interacting serine/threonine-protein kinase 4-like [Chenopodium quinoa]|uniref:CBL-interacting serine/threonine-protein kinase 4-like n=1 Tax=Chenopodium quinoa TaxID=63459 RepID=UPI000B78DB54|nr:CBL-interacting serine/threonine-protein kinase 4-like [Chenopodium quinoa]
MAAAVAEPPSSSSSPPSSSSNAAKTILGRYQSGKLLGKGSFAKVYHARSLTNNQSVAIKVIDKSKTHPSMEPRIVGEVAAMRRLNHPNILKIHEVLASKSKIYLVMELAKGGDLFGKLSRRADHRFPEPLARKYFHQLVSALHYCHQNGVAHRDVKPQNLLLDEEGNIKVSDFGLSAVAESAVAVSKEKMMLQTSCGTPAFAAPEIVGRTRNGYDGSKADAWSCGVILFVMLTGYLPFDDGNLVMMYRKMHRKEYRFPSWVSKPARGLISRLLDPIPKSRLSIDDIPNDSWFKNHGMLYPRSVSLGDMASLEEKKYKKMLLLERCNTMSDSAGNNGDKARCGGGESMNAFEIITMSSGLNLSGMFDQDYSEGRREKRFTSREPKAVVVEKVVGVGENLGYEVEKRENCCGNFSVWLGKGRFVLSVTVSEVAAELVVVEMKVVDGGGVGWDQEEVHWEQLKSGLGDIVVSWHQ